MAALVGEIFLHEVCLIAICGACVLEHSTQAPHHVYVGCSGDTLAAPHHCSACAAPALGKKGGILDVRCESCVSTCFTWAIHEESACYVPGAACKHGAVQLRPK